MKRLWLGSEELGKPTKSECYIFASRDMNPEPLTVEAGVLLIAFTFGLKPQDE